MQFSAHVIDNVMDFDFIFFVQICFLVRFYIEIKVRKCHLMNQSDVFPRLESFVVIDQFSRQSHQMFFIGTEAKDIP